MKSENKQKFSLTGLLTVIGVLVLLTAVLVPLVPQVKLRADLNTIGRRGQDIYIALLCASTRGEPMFPFINMWPKVKIDGEDHRNIGETEDITDKTFQNSTRYFHELYDGENIGTPATWAPYVNGFDWSKLAGAGVPKMVGAGVLRSENNIWSIAGNLTDDMDDMIPALVTRNVDCSSFHIKTRANPDAPLRWSQQYNTPFGNKGFVIVRKGGAVLRGIAKRATTSAVYPIGDVTQTAGNTNLAFLVYLTPDGIAYPQ